MPGVSFLPLSTFFIQAGSLCNSAPYQSQEVLAMQLAPEICACLISAGGPHVCPALHGL